MNHLDAIEEVLKKARMPMSCKELADEVIRLGLVAKHGKTLHASLNRDLNKDVVKAGSRFVKMAAGRFALVESSAVGARGELSEKAIRRKHGVRNDIDAAKGFVYILKDGHYKKWAKIGRAKDVASRVRPMYTANPLLEVYCKVETSKWIELEKAAQNVIKLVAKSKQVKNSEWYLIEPEKAKHILLEFGRVFDREDFKMSVGDSLPDAGTDTGCTWKGPTEFAKYVAKRGGNIGAFGGILHFLSRRKPCSAKSKWRKPLEFIGVKFDKNDFVLDWKCAKKR